MVQDYGNRFLEFMPFNETPFLSFETLISFYIGFKIFRSEPNFGSNRIDIKCFLLEIMLQMKKV